MKRITPKKWNRSTRSIGICHSPNSWRSLPKSIEPDDLKRLLKKRFTPQPKCMLLLLLRTGMRISELLALEPKDVKIKQRKILINRGSKTGDGRVVYISDDALVALKKWLKIRDSKRQFLFYSSNREKMSYATARTIFCDCLKKSYLKKKGYTLHCLRHTFASELLSAGIPLESLQILMGHSSLEVTRRYARLTNIALKQDYFEAMQVIESGGINGTYRHFSPIQ